VKGPSSNVSAAVFGTVHFVITCARGARGVCWTGEALARRADTKNAPFRMRLLNNIVTFRDVGDAGRKDGGPSSKLVPHLSPQ
jgi:hypothetical protein